MKQLLGLLVLGLIFISKTHALASSSGLVGISATAQSKYAVAGVVNKLNVLIQIKTLEKLRDSQKQRSPYEIVLVLDQSGSMAGEKLHHSKEAIIEIIKNLLPGDRLHLVVYHTHVNVIFEDGSAEQREDLISKVRSITDLGSTNLSGGLQKAFEIMRAKMDSGSSNTEGQMRAKRIFLFSDGLPNVGETNPQQLFQIAKNGRTELKGVTVSSFGIGADFDEKVMSGIAEHGGGDYMFIQNADSIPRLVELTMKQFVGLIGTDALLGLRGLNGAVVTRCVSYPLEQLATGIKLQDIRENDLRKLLVELEYKAPGLSNEQEPSPVDILAYELSYKPQPDGQQDKAATDERTSISGTVSVTATNDPVMMEKEENKDVKTFVALKQIEEQDAAILDLLESGDIEGAKKEKMIVIQALKNMPAEDEEVQVRYQRASRSMDMLNDELVPAAAKVKRQHYDNALGTECSMGKAQL